MDRIYLAALIIMLNAIPSLEQLVQTPSGAVTGLCHVPARSASPSMASLGSGTAQSSSFSFTYASSSPSAPSADTVGDLLKLLGDIESEDLAWTTDTNNNTLIQTTSSTSLDKRDFVNSVDKVRFRKALNVYFNSTDHGGYNLTIPGCLAADTIIGDAELPNGTFVTNATFATLITSMQIPSESLYNYTLTMATIVYNKINTTLNEMICEGAAGATRQLLMPNWGRPGFRDPNNSEGFMTAFIVGLLGTTGIAWTGTRLAIAHHAPTQNISIDTEVAILAGTTAMEFIFITMLWRLQSVPKRWVGRGEAIVLNAFIWIGGKMLQGLEWINSHSCFSTETAQTGLSDMMARAQQNVQLFRFRYLRDANAASSQNLVDANLVNVEVGQVAQAAAQVAIQAVVQQQVEGGIQPGQTCGGSGGAAGAGDGGS